MDFNEIIKWPGYPLGALKKDATIKTFHSGDGDMWAVSRSGRYYNVHPLVIKAGGPDAWGAGANPYPEVNYLPGVYPIRWEEY